MAVVFKGGSSGNRGDYGAPTPDTGAPQPILRTQTSGQEPANVHFQAASFSVKVDPEETATPDFMPTGGTFPESSSDICQQDIEGIAYSETSGDRTIFRGAPNTGTKGGPG